MREFGRPSLPIELNWRRCGPCSGPMQFLRSTSKSSTTPCTIGWPGRCPRVILVSQDEVGTLTGFLEVGLRSHADGCNPAQPVGYVEGWFVQEAFRNRGVGTELMRAAEDWARSLGCIEMASDALIDNEGSQSAHEALGFEVVDRCVHFRKGL